MTSSVQAARDRRYKKSEWVCWVRGAESILQEGRMGQAGVKFKKLVDKQDDASGKVGWVRIRFDMERPGAQASGGSRVGGLIFFPSISLH